MVVRRGLLAVLTVLLIGLAPSGQAQQRPSDEAAEKFIAQLADRAARTLTEGSGTLEQREAALRDLLRDGFDIDLISRIAMGKYWRKIPRAERPAYVELFGEFLLRTYGTKLATFKREEFTVAGSTKRGKRDVIVHTKIGQPGGAPINAGWRVRLIDGQLRIIDILIEGVSMALNQRQEFKSVLSKSGFPGLLEMLRARTQRLPAQGPDAAAQARSRRAQGR